MICQNCSPLQYFFFHRWWRADISSQTLYYQLQRLLNDLSTMAIYPHISAPQDFTKFRSIFFGTRRLTQILVNLLGTRRLDQILEKKFGTRTKLRICFFCVKNVAQPEGGGLFVIRKVSFGLSFL